MSDLSYQPYCTAVRRWSDLRLALFTATIARAWPNRPYSRAAYAEAASRQAAPRGG
jgi:hypothetical protein